MPKQYKQACPKGHAYTEDNTYILPSTGWRICRTCKTLQNQKQHEKNKDKRNANTRRWHKENKERVSVSKKKYWDKLAAFLKEKKDVPCADCGIKYPSYVMDFDHITGDKEFNLGTITSIKRAKLEIEKCEVVCANCHRERTWGKKNESTELTKI